MTKNLASRLAALAALIAVAAAVAFPRPSAQAAPARIEQALTRPIETSFVPSKAGFPFRNWKGGNVLLGELIQGRCGGMAFAALDYFSAGLTPLADPERVKSYIVRRDGVSVLSNATRFALWSMWPDRDTWWSPGVTEMTREKELPALAQAMGKGPVAIGLVRAKKLGEVQRNHQVVAYGMRRQGDVVAISIYDPNDPGADDVVLEVDLAQPGSPIWEYRGDQAIAVWRGIFVEQYAPAAPPSV